MSSHLWFTPSVLLAEVQRRGLELGIVIDLTYTDRYYQRKVLHLYSVLPVTGRWCDRHQFIRCVLMVEVI